MPEQLAFPWEREAMEGRPTPQGISLIDQRTYQALASLYGRYRLGLIDRKAGSAEKKVILSVWKMESETARFHSELAQWHTQLRKEIEGAQNRYRKDRTLENADRLSKALDGILEAIK